MEEGQKLARRDGEEQDEEKVHVGDVVSVCRFSVRTNLDGWVWVGRHISKLKFDSSQLSVGRRHHGSKKIVMQVRMRIAKTVDETHVLFNNQCTSDLMFLIALL